MPTHELVEPGEKQMLRAAVEATIPPNTLQENCDRLLERVRDLAPRSFIEADLDFSLIKASDGPSDSVHSKILSCVTSICHAKIRVCIDTQTIDELAYILDYTRRLPFQTKTMLIDSPQWDIHIESIVFFISLLKDESWVSLAGHFLEANSETLTKLIAALKAPFKIVNLSQARLDVASEGSLRTFVDGLQGSTIALVDIGSIHQTSKKTIEGKDPSTFITTWGSLEASELQPLLGFSHPYGWETILNSINGSDRKSILNLAKMYYGRRLAERFYRSWTVEQRPNIFKLSTQESFEVAEFLVAFSCQHGIAKYHLEDVSESLFEDPQARLEWRKNLAHNLHYVHHELITRVKELPPHVKTSMQLNLSLVKANDPVSELLYQEILKHSDSICDLQIKVFIGAKTIPELAYIAEYIRKIKLERKILLIENPEWETPIETLLFFIRLFKNEMNLCLGDSFFNKATPSDIEKLIETLKETKVKVLRFSEAQLELVPAGSFRTLTDRLKETNVAFIDMGNPRKTEGQDVSEFIKEWCSKEIMEFRPLLAFPQFDKKNLEKLVGVFDRRSILNLAKMYYGSHLMQRMLNAWSECVDPVIFKLSRPDSFEVVRFIAGLHHRHGIENHHLLETTEKFILSAEDRERWIRDLIKKNKQFLHSYELKKLGISKIPEKDKLDIFLAACSEDPFDFVDIQYFWVAFPDTPGHRLLSSFEIMDEALLDAGLDTVVSTLTEQCIPLLEQHSARYLGPSFSFVPDCAASIRTQYKNHGDEASYAILRMVAWLGWSSTKIDFIWQTLNPELIKSLVKKPSFDEKKKRMPEPLRDAFNHVMKQIFDFAHPTARYALTDTFLEKLCADEKKIYFTLTTGLSLDTLLPAIPLTAIFLQEPNRRLKVKHEKYVRELLPLLANDQFYGRFQRTMVSGLMSIANDTTLTPSQKFDIIQEVVSKDKQHLKSENLLKDIIALSKKPKTPKNDQSIDNLLSTLEEHDLKLYERLELSLWGFGSQGSTTEATKSQQKLATLLKKEGPKIKRDCESIDKAIKSLEDIVQTHYKEKHFKRMISRFIMVQGLAGIQRLSALCRREASSSESVLEASTENFDLQARTIFQEIFGITPEQFVHHPETFAQCHNESAVLTYYSKLCTLKGEDAEKAMAVFQSFVQGVLSHNSADFYRTRYDKTKNPHLAAVLEDREELEKAWVPESGPTDYSTALTPFILEHDIKHQDYKPDFVKLIREKIFGHQHLDPQYYQKLQQYLEASDGSEKAQIKEAIRLALPLEQAEDKHESGENTPAIPHEEIQKQRRAKLELALVELLEIPVDPSMNIDKRYEEHLKALQKIYQLLSNIHSNTHHFREDLQTLIRGLKNNKKPVQPINAGSFPDYKLVVTDRYWPLFMAGTDVEGSCQSVDGTADLNKCLMGYVMNGHVKMMAILNPEDVIFGRCMLKLLRNEATGEPVLFLEEIYPESLRADFREALIQYAIQYAAELGLPLATIQTLPFEYESAAPQAPIGESTSIDEPILECTGGYAVYEYVDAVFEATQGPYSIEKGIQFIYQPAAPEPKPLQGAGAPITYAYESAARTSQTSDFVEPDEAPTIAFCRL